MLFKTKSRFETTVLPHLPSAYNLARWLLRSDSDAEDAVQEACLRAYEHFGELKSANAGPWLLTIVRNAAFTLLRKNRTGAEAISLELLDNDAMIGSVDAAETEALQQLSVQELHSAIDRLPTEFKEMVVLRDLEGYSYSEIAEITRLPIGTVMSRLSRARKRLRQMLTPLIAEDGEVNQ